MAKVRESSPSFDYIQMILSNSGPTTSIEEINKKGLEFIEDVTMNADEVQTRVLAEILSRSAHVEYLSKHNLQGRTDRESFKKAIPVVTYEDIAPYIKRIANGDRSPILCSQPIHELLTSSGTSGGEAKLIPSIEEDQLVIRPIIRCLTFPVMSQFVPGLDFLCVNHELRTPSGLAARPSLTSYFKSPRFASGHLNERYTNSTSPKETVLCPDSHQSTYCQMLCGLSQQDQVLCIGSVFASGLIRAIKLLQSNWELLCNDIRAGLPNPTIVTDKAVLDAVNRVLMARGPDPDLAGFVEDECRRGSWQGILRRLWPNAKYLDVAVTGTMSQYIPTLNYYSDGLPIVCTMYASTEVYIGINLNPFILVLRLYRYRMGDILEVAGFKNKAPQFKFLRRNNVALSIDVDKTDEVELHNAVYSAVNNHLLPLGATLIDYTSYADTTTIPGHYVLYWEIDDHGDVSDSALEDCCHAVEECLNGVYRQFRVFGKSIGPLEIRVVQSGTFDKLMDYKISHGGSIGQYKTPRCVKEAPIIDLLDTRVVTKCFSRECPRWVPDQVQWPGNS